MERAERMMLVGLGLIFSPFLVPILWLMLVLTAVTAVHRFVMVWRQGSTPRRPSGDRLLRSWRGWRPGEGFELRRRETRARWRERTRPPRPRG